MVELDRVDRKILNVLQSDSGITNLALAELVSLSPSACLRRVQRLRDEKVIQRDVSLVDPVSAGIKLTAFVEVTLERHSEDLKSTFQRRVLKEPAVTQCYMVAGETDAMLVVNLKDMEEYAEFTRRIFDTDRRVLRYRTVFAIRRVKFDTRVPFEE